jgi:hypothetical protein
MEQASTPVAAKPPPDPDRRRTRMCWFMVGAGAVTALSSFMGWVSGDVDSMSGFSWGPGKVTLVTGILMALYGAQGLRKDDPNVRHHGWAIAAVTVSALVTLGAAGLIDEVDDATLGLSGVEYGTGLLLAFVASFFAIWPLVVLRKDARARETGLVAPGAGTVLHGPAGWYADPWAQHERRYFDGATWTDHVADGRSEAVSTQSPAAAAPAPPPPAAAPPPIPEPEPEPEPTPEPEPAPEPAAPAATEAPPTPAEPEPEPAPTGAIQAPPPNPAERERGPF